MLKEKLMKKSMVQALILFVLVTVLVSIVYQREIKTMAGWPGAVKSGSWLAVKLHLLLGADVNAVKPGFKTPLEEAIWLRADADIINELLDHKPDRTRLVDKQSSLLVKAIGMLDFAKVPTDQTISILRRLLEFGEDINFVERNTTPIFTAAMHGRPDLVKFLLEAGADPAVVIKDPGSPFETTIFDQFTHARSNEVMEVLLNSDKNLNLQKMLVSAVIAKNMPAIKMLVKKGASLNHTVEKNYTTLLMHAALVFDEAQVKEFVDLGADINIADSFGRNVLATCIQQDKYKLAEYFIQKGTSVNYVDNSGESLLSYFLDHQEKFKDLNDVKTRMNFMGFLKKSGLNINFQNPKNGQTAVMRALCRKNSKIADIWVSLLISMKDTDNNLQDNDGKTALMHAVEQGNEKIVKMLLLAKADKEIKDKKGLSALDYATEKDDIKIINMLKFGVKAEE